MTACAGLRPHHSVLPADSISQCSAHRPQSVEGVANQGTHQSPHSRAHKGNSHHSNYSPHNRDSGHADGCANSCTNSGDSGNHAHPGANRQPHSGRQRRQMEPADVAGGRQVHPGQGRPARDGAQLLKLLLIMLCFLCAYLHTMLPSADSVRSTCLFCFRTFQQRHQEGFVAHCV